MCSSHMHYQAAIPSLLPSPSSSHNPETDQVFNQQGSLLLRGAKRDFLKEVSPRKHCMSAEIHLESVMMMGRGRMHITKVTFFCQTTTKTGQITTK